MNNNKQLISYLFWIWTGIMLMATLIPGKSIPESPFLNIPHLDKIIHGLMFAVFAFLLLNWREQRDQENFNFHRNFIFAILIALLYGLFIESIQIPIPGRNFDFLDIFANFIGTLTGLLLFRIKFNFFDV